MPNKPETLKLDVADKANSFIVGREALPLNDMSDDYPAFLVANYLLGDSPTSRLWERLRQKEGLSYGTGTSFRVNSFEPNSTLIGVCDLRPAESRQDSRGARRGIRHGAQERLHRHGGEPRQDRIARGAQSPPGRGRDVSPAIS